MVRKPDKLRLQKYIAGINNEAMGVGHYKHLSLYQEKDTMNYTMSWVISKYFLNAMDTTLYAHPELNNLISEMKSRKK